MHKKGKHKKTKKNYQQKYSKIKKYLYLINRHRIVFSFSNHNLLGTFRHSVQSKQAPKKSKTINKRKKEKKGKHRIKLKIKITKELEIKIKIKN